MGCRKIKVAVIAWEVSRRGGIEEVCRQTIHILRQEKSYDVTLIKFPQSNYLSYFFIVYIILKFSRGSICIFMHPYIFEKFKKIPLPLINYKSICFAYGIDVWGNYGKSRSTNLKNANLVLSVSNYTTLRLLNNYPDLKIKTIRLGIDTSIINNTNNICKNGFEILTVGRLSSSERYKGHDLVIQAIKLLKDKKVNVKYNIVGDGDDIARLKNLSNEIDVRDRINFYGYISDDEISYIYKKSSAFVMPSTVIERKNAIWGGEGLGLVYLEAGLYKLPVIASNLGGQTDCIINNVTGYLIEPTPENIASKIEILFKNKQIRESMGCAAEKFILEKFTSKQFSKNLLSIIRKI